MPFKSPWSKWEKLMLRLRSIEEIIKPLGAKGKIEVNLLNNLIKEAFRPDPNDCEFQLEPIVIHKLKPIIEHCLKNPTAPMAEAGVFDGGVVGILSDNFLDSTIYAYDTFEGLPEACWTKDEPHQAGQFKPTHDVIKFLSNRKNVVVRKGLFPESIGEESNFWMVHLDLDFYLSTLNALKILIPRMAKGGIIFLDDYEWHMCPGVKKATDELGLHVKINPHWQGVLTF